MRKILIILLIIILLILGYFMIFNGLKIFGGEVLSIFQIKDKSDKLDKELASLSTLTSVEQPKVKSDLNESTKQLLIAKQDYNDKILYSSTEEIAKASQGIQHEMEHLWVKVGNHATKNGINLKFEVRKSTSGGTNLYDLYFTVTGKYVSVSEFIASLENDSSLNFKIEKFKLIPYEGSTENLQAVFVVRDIGIQKIDEIKNMQNTAEPSNMDNNS